MDIELAGRPETIEVDETHDVAIRVPLTAEPDGLLLEALKKSPPISNLCARLEAGDRELIVYLNDRSVGGLGTAMTAIQALVSSTNDERAAQNMTKEELEAQAAADRRRAVEGELSAWWEEHGRSS
ncbi:MAG TPA: hypothetical protein VHT25_01580 [Solirubrobacteraceae bacterium]|jgi:hypothetical protein|nr:hypothetical protein [Solirubrobacteraceae bacterium]